jgi:hypothetical protein
MLPSTITSLKGSDALQEVKIPIVRKKKCKKAFSFTINKSQICAGYNAFCVFYFSLECNGLPLKSILDE